MPDARQLWQTALGELQLLMTRANYETWLAQSEGLGFDGEILRIGVRSPFTQEALATRFSPLVRRTLAGIVGRPVEVRYEIVSGEPAGLSAAPLFSAARSGRPASALLADEPEPVVAHARAGAPAERVRELAPATRRQPAPAAPRPPLNPRYTFATFVVGTGNQLAHAAAQGVAEALGQKYNPLFIYGGVGLGKTHLLHAIGNIVLERGMVVLYVSSETFMNDLIDAIGHQRTEEFRQKYRRCDVLLIDDIQFIAGKERTQEEFFHTFNAIHGGGGQIVLTSDRHPSEMSTLEDRLRSRFEWGLIADIQRPDLETRIAILRSKLNGRENAVPIEVLEFIAHKAQSNIRELEGSLNRVLAYAQLNRAGLTVDLAATALQAVSASQSGRAVARPEEIIQAVSRYYGVSVGDLRGKQRDKRIVGPRQVAMFLMREDARISTPEIGRHLGGRDHTTVMHGAQKITAELPRDPQLRGDLQAIRELVQAK